MHKGGIHMIKEVQMYYDEQAEREWERLTNAYSMIEFTTTMHLIERYFPSKGRLLDIGCGPGRYSLALAEKGYEMSLLDISSKELALAEKFFQERSLKAEGFYHACSMTLDFEDDTFDGVIVLGPLYHLHTEDERQMVIDEVYRVLKPGGTAILAYINSLGVLRASAYECPDVFEENEVMLRYLEGDVALSHEEGFTAAYFTTPESALREIKRSSFDVISRAGAESFVAGMQLELHRLKENEPALYNRYLDMAKSVCEHEAYRDATEHLNIVVKKPNNLRPC